MLVAIGVLNRNTGHLKIFEKFIGGTIAQQNI